LHRRGPMRRCITPLEHRTCAHRRCLYGIFNQYTGAG
jgi:hypothetical protein